MESDDLMMSVLNVQAIVPRRRQSLQIHDEVDLESMGTISKTSRSQKPGHIIPSKMTDTFSYDTSNKNRGTAIIFNHEYVVGETRRRGTKKDGDDLKAVLEELGFDVTVYDDLELKDIKTVLREVSNQDHLDSDCLLVTVMSHGGSDGKILAADKEYLVQELWENFVGENCKSLIGKPKLFFIQACRGTVADYGILFNFKPNVGDEVDAQRTEQTFVIPSLADLLIMYSTSKDHYSFRNSDGSWFIQALCKELKDNPQLDLLHILTRVNGRVAFEKQSNVPGNYKLDCAKQMPNIVSILTKTLYFKPKNNSIDQNSLPQPPVRKTKRSRGKFWSCCLWKNNES